MELAKRILGRMGDSDRAVVRDKLSAFRLLLLIHVSIQSWHWAYVVSGIAGADIVALCLAAAYLTALAAASLVPRAARFAPLAAMPAMACQIYWLFPGLTNHFFLSFWVMGLLATLGSVSVDDDEGQLLLLQAIQWSVVIVLFYTGFQKAIHGSYFQGEFLAFKIATSESFRVIFSFFLPAEELARLTALGSMQEGSGPIRSTAPLFLVASNSVYLVEMGLAAALVHRRTRTLAALFGIVFVAGIQAGAREVLFALMMSSLLLLFPSERPWLRSLMWIIAAVYAYVFLMSMGVVPGESLLSDPGVPGRVHL